MLANPLWQLGGIEMPFKQGDVLALAEVPVAVDGTASFTFAAKDLASGDIFVSGGAGVNGTLPTSDALINALRGSMNLISPPGNALYGGLPSQSVQLAWPANLMPFEPGTTFRRTIANNNTGTVTMVTAAGFTLTSPTTVITVNWREYLFTITNSSPTTTMSASTHNGTKILDNIDLVSINNVTPGMTISGTGITAGTKVVAVNRDLGKVTTDTNSTADGDNIGITFTSTIGVRGMKSGTV